MRIPWPALIGVLALGCLFPWWGTEPPEIQEVASLFEVALDERRPYLEFQIGVDPRGRAIHGTEVQYAIHIEATSPFRGDDLYEPQTALGQEAGSGRWQHALGAAEMQRLRGKVVTYRWVVRYRTKPGGDLKEVTSAYYRTSQGHPEDERVEP